MARSDDAPTGGPSLGEWAPAAVSADIVAAVVALAMVLWIVITPGDEDPSDTPTANSADAGFARDMAVDRQQAVEMSFVVRDRTDDEDVRRLAYDIAQTQANQRGMLHDWLDLWDLPKTSADGYMNWTDKGRGSSHTRGRDERRLSDAQHGYRHRTRPTRQGSGQERRDPLPPVDEIPQEQHLVQGMVYAQQSETKLMADLLRERGSAPR